MVDSLIGLEQGKATIASTRFKSIQVGEAEEMERVENTGVFKLCKNFGRNPVLAC